MGELVALFLGLRGSVEHSVIFVQADLNSFSDAAEYATRFLAMIAGPLYPILQIVKERLVSLISCTRYFSDRSTFL